MSAIVGTMKISKAAAIRKAGGQGALARILEITPSAVSQWGEYMPPLQAYKLRAAKPRWIAGLVAASAEQVADKSAA